MKIQEIQESIASKHMELVWLRESLFAILLTSGKPALTWADLANHTNAPTFKVPRLDIKQNFEKEGVQSNSALWSHNKPC